MSVVSTESLTKSESSFENISEQNETEAPSTTESVDNENINGSNVEEKINSLNCNFKSQTSIEMSHSEDGKLSWKREDQLNHVNYIKTENLFMLEEWWSIFALTRLVQRLPNHFYYPIFILYPLLIFSTVCYHPRKLIDLFRSCDQQSSFKIFVNFHNIITVFGLNLVVIFTFWKCCKNLGKRTNKVYPEVFDPIIGLICRMDSGVQISRAGSTQSDSFGIIINKFLHSWIFTVSIGMLYAWGIPMMFPDFKYTLKDFFYPSFYPTFIKHFFRLFYIQM